ncbi:hypothetical protein B0H16DRAFT_1518657 [Mycena metata]|uniref:Zn(2)-C6 fungal-type domain-containing protein n=1 Tax=Mycena metata TaxID=1033252 RepID=A0AAD7JS02_9AGAR|nr:hypothetical protein B0H16DRAFT_1518657 [Mycena metata]
MIGLSCPSPLYFFLLLAMLAPLDPELPPDASGNMDEESLPLLFPLSPPRRGSFDELRLPSHPRSFSHSPQPIYPGGPDTNLLSRPSYSDVAYLDTDSRFDGDPVDLYRPHSTTAIEEFLDASLMAVQYLDLPHTSDNSFGASYSHSASSASSPEATDTASSSSSHADTLSTDSSPGYLLNDLPEARDTARLDPRFGEHHLGYYGGPYEHYNTRSEYAENPRLLRYASFQGSPLPRRQTNNLGASLPSISHNSRYTMSYTSAPPPPHTRTFGQFPVADELQRWPQMFKIDPAKKDAPKKQHLSCFFCRSRKISCARPDDINGDQTCNQCVRRKRTCVYPTESRRGQHTRNRLNSKKFLGLEDTGPPTPPKVTGLEY